MEKTKMPSIRDIFDQFEFIDEVTPEYENLQNELTAMLKSKFPDFKEYDKIDCLITGNCCEAQTMGFEQGFRYAVTLLTSGVSV